MSLFDSLADITGVKIEKVDEEEIVKEPKKAKVKEAEAKAKPAKKEKTDFFGTKSNVESVANSTIKKFRPTQITDAQLVCDTIKEGESVIVDVEGLAKNDIMRLYDFLSGVRYALNAKQLDVTENVFIITPETVAVGDLKRANQENDLDADYFDNDDYFSDNGDR